LWPFPTEALTELSERVDRIVVAEMNLGQMLGEVQRAVGNAECIQTWLKADGETILPEEILAMLVAQREVHV
jgi:2-oxoglutarate ferredoxin oxidoreductase subunit alpha